MTSAAVNMHVCVLTGVLLVCSQEWHSWVIWSFCSLLRKLLQISIVIAFPPPECMVIFLGDSCSLWVPVSSNLIKQVNDFLPFLDGVHVTLQFFILMFDRIC